MVNEWNDLNVQDLFQIFECWVIINLLLLSPVPFLPSQQHIATIYTKRTLMYGDLLCLTTILQLKWLSLPARSNCTRMIGPDRMMGAWDTTTGQLNTAEHQRVGVMLLMSSRKTRNKSYVTSTTEIQKLNGYHLLCEKFLYYFIKTKNIHF